MLGVGKEMWEHESGDSFVARLRAEEILEPPVQNESAMGVKDLLPTVWSRIEEHQGEPFHTATGLPFTYQVEGNGVWFFRNKKRINRKLTRKHIDEAISRCPLKSTTEIKDLMDFAYLFAMLMDRRIRGQAW